MFSPRESPRICHVLSVHGQILPFHCHVLPVHYQILPDYHHVLPCYHHVFYHVLPGYYHAFVCMLCCCVHVLILHSSGLALLLKKRRSKSTDRESTRPKHESSRHNSTTKNAWGLGEKTKWKHKRSQQRISNVCKHLTCKKQPTSDDVHANKARWQPATRADSRRDKQTPAAVDLLCEASIPSAPTHTHARSSTCSHRHTRNKARSV